MNPSTISASELLHKYGIRAEKSLGQNFLHQPTALQAITSSAEIEPDDHVLEIGPGLGSLTCHLATSAKSVVCVELDNRLIPILQSVLKPYSNVNIIQGDILGFPPESIITENNYIVVANVPYYITSAIFRHLLEATQRPKRIVLTVQKEVAERICEKPGNMSLLALSIQVYGSPKITATIPAEAFYPAPRVDSAVIRVDMYSEPYIPSPLLNTFFHLAKAGFSQKRKTLRNSLSGGLQISADKASTLLANSNIDPMRRAETLSLEEWHTLSQNFSEKKY